MERSLNSLWCSLPPRGSQDAPLSSRDPPFLLQRVVSLLHPQSWSHLVHPPLPQSNPPSHLTPGSGWSFHLAGLQTCLFIPPQPTGVTSGTVMTIAPLRDDSFRKKRAMVSSLPEPELHTGAIASQGHHPPLLTQAALAGGRKRRGWRLGGWMGFGWGTKLGERIWIRFKRGAPWRPGRRW